LRLVGFGRETSFFIRDRQPGIYRTNPRFTETFFAASFGLKPLNFRLPKMKPAGVVRVFVLGESAAMGVPEPGFALAPQLRAQLRAGYPGQQIEVYNLGITAINSHVVRLIARDAAAFSPDVFVIYMGNNEVVGPFGPGSALTDAMLPLPWIRASTAARATRTGQLIEAIAQRFHRHGGFRDWRGMEMFANRRVPATDPRLKAVYANFAANLSDILDTAAGAGAKVVLATVAVDFADCAPFISVHRPGMSADERARWQDTYHRAIVAQELERWTEADSLLNAALQLDPAYAETEFRLGRVRAAQHDDAGAKLHFARALQLDALRFRTDATLNDLIRTAARRSPDRITLVDAAAWLGATATSAAPVSSHHLFFEHVHFTWDGNYALARALVPAIGQAIFGGAPAAILSPEACAARTGYTPIGALQMAMRMNELTGRPPFTGQYTFAEDRGVMQQRIDAAYAVASKPQTLRPAIAAIEAAARDDPTNAFLDFQAATANSEAGDISRALDYNNRVLALEPESAENLAQRAYLLASAHRSSEAERVLLASAESEPYYFQTYTLLAQLWSQGKVDEGRRYFAQLVQRMPDSAVVRTAYANLLSTAGDNDGAEAQWRAILQRTPDNESALAPLAQHLVRRGDKAAALELMRQAYAYNPRSFANNERLLQYYAQQGDRPQTAAFMQAFADSGPVTAALYADLGDLLLQLNRRTDALVAFTQAERRAQAKHEDDIAKHAADAIRENHLTWP